MPHLAAFRRAVPLLTALACLLAAPAAGAAAAKSTPTRPAAANATVTGGYKGAIVIDAATGDTLFEDQPDFSGPPASMAKLMTFAVLHDRLARGTLTLDTVVKANAADTRMGGTQVWLKEHEEFSVEELIHAMMIQSANDASHALARTAAGSVEAFVGEMNAKARELGMTGTTFRTPHGLPPANRRLADGDLTTPRDFARLSRHLVLHTDILRYTSIRTRDFGPPVRLQAVAMKNHNNLLGKVAGVDGLKTGYTAGAGFCLAATAQRNGRRVIVAVLGGESAQKRDLKVTELIERAFTVLPPSAPTQIDPAALPSTANARPIPLDRPAPAPAPAEEPIRLTVPKRK